MALSKRQQPMGLNFPLLKRFRLNPSLTTGGTDIIVDNIIPKLKTTTVYKRVLGVELYNKDAGIEIIPPKECQQCVVSRKYTLLCCGLKMCKECAPDVDDLIVSHGCFVGPGSPVCAVCSIQMRNIVSKTLCCSTSLCDRHMGQWYDFTNLGNSCAHCGTKHDEGDVKRKFIRKNLIKEHEDTNVVMVKKYLKDRRYIDNDLLNTLATSGFTGVDLLDFLGDLNPGSLMEMDPLPVVPAYLLAVQTYDYKSLALNLDDDTVVRCPNGDCAGNLIAGSDGTKRTRLPVLMGLGYKSIPGKNQCHATEHGCLACIIRTQELYVANMMVQGVHSVDAPLGGNFVLSIMFDPSVALTPIKILGHNTAIEFRGKIGCFVPTYYYQLNELLSKLKWISPKRSPPRLDHSMLFNKC